MMLDLKLENLEKYLEYVDKQLRVNIDEVVSKVADKEGEMKATSIIHHSWGIVRDLLCDKGYTSKLSLEHMKEDIIMSIYAAVVYDMLPPVERISIIKGAAKVMGGTSFENTVRKAIDNAENYFIKNLDCWDNRRNYYNIYEWDYFKSVIKSSDKKENNRIKVFDEYDFYVFLDAREYWLFNHKNSCNGMMICDWYAGVKKILDQLSKKQSEKEKTAKDILNLFIVEQMFSVNSITTIIQSWIKTTNCDFYSLDNGQREKELFLISGMAGLPKLIIEKNIGRLIIAHEIWGEEMWYKPLYNQIFQINWLKLYIYPLCKILLYYTIVSMCKGIKGANSKSVVEESIRKYIEDRKNLERFTYLYNFNDCYKEFSKLRYPLDYNEKANSKGGGQKLIDKSRNNIPIESFGINFTYFYLIHNIERNVFELQNIYRNEKFFKQNERAAAYFLERGDLDYNRYIINTTKQKLQYLAQYENYKTDNYKRYIGN